MSLGEDSCKSISDKEIVSRIYKEHLQFNNWANTEQLCSIKKWTKDYSFINTLPKNMYKRLGGPWKDALHC